MGLSTFNPIHRIDPGIVISPTFKKQANPQTVLADVDLTASFPFVGDPVLRRSQVIRSDRAMTGKGHGFSTPANFKQVQRDIDGTRTFQVNSSIVGWGAAGCLGSVTSVQPNPGGNPTAWDHTIKFVNPLTAGRHAPVTTIYEQLAAVSGWQKKVRAVAVDRITISGSRRDPLTLAMDLVTSGQDVEDAVTVPAVGTFDILDTGGTVFKIGALGAGADISDRLRGFTAVAYQAIDRANGYFPSSGLYRERFWIGQQGATLTFQLWARAADADIKALWENGTKQEVRITTSGTVIGSGPEKHKVELFYPSVILKGSEIRVEDEWHLYEVTIDEETMFKDAAAGIVEPIQIVVTNLTTAYLN